MDTPAGAVSRETIVRRSRFIAQITPVTDRKQAEQEIETRRTEHPDASHVVFAFIVGPERSSVSGMSDDGEPKGTAGRPVMEILKGSGMTNAVVTVVRYFGGTKLGTGGLVRAYGDAARKVLAAVGRVPFRILHTWWVEFPYEIQQEVRTILDEADVEIQDERYAEQVRVVFAVEKERVEAINRRLADVSRGTIQLRPE